MFNSFHAFNKTRVARGTLPEISSFTHSETNPVFSHCIAALQKPFYDRILKDTKFIIDCLKTFKYFTHIFNANAIELEQAFTALSEVVEHRYYSVGDIIYHKGEHDDHLYLILAGQTVLLAEVAEDIFQAPKENRDQESTDALPSLEVAKIKSTNNEESQRRNMFQPKMSKSVLKRLTSFGGGPSLNEPMASVKALPTVNDVHTLHDIGTDLDSSPSMKNNTLSGVGKDELDARSMLSMFKFILKAEKMKPGKYIHEGKFLYKPKKIMESGSHFGEKASKNSKVHVMTAIAAEDCSIVKFKIEDYVRIFGPLIDDRNHDVEFIEGFFPDASYVKLKKLVELFEEQVFLHKQTVFEEETPPDALYLIKEGEVQLRMTVDPSRYQWKERHSTLEIPKKRINIASVTKGEAIGEDDAFSGEDRNYTAIVTSTKLVVWKLSMTSYNGISNVYKGLFDSMKNAARAKNEFRKSQNKSQMERMVQLAKHVAKLKHQAKYESQSQNELKRQGSPSPIMMTEEPKSPIRPMRLNSIEEDDWRRGDLSGQNSPTKSYSTVARHAFQRQISIADSVESPSLGNFSIGPANADIDKYKHQPYFSTKLTSVLEQQHQKIKHQDMMLNNSINAKKGHKSEILGTSTEEVSAISLYKEAVGNRKRKPINKFHFREKISEANIRIGEHKHYFDDLQRSIDTISKFGPRSSSPFDEGYMGVNMSPISRLQKDENQELIWESILFKNNVDLKAVLPGSLIRDKSLSGLKRDPSLDNKKRDPKESSSLDPSTRRPVIHLEQIRNMAHRAKHLTIAPKCTVDGYNIRRKTTMTDDLDDDYRSNQSFGEGKSKSHIKLTNMLKILDNEHLEHDARRAGFKPSKLRLPQPKDKGKAEVIIMGRKYSQKEI